MGREAFDREWPCHAHAGFVFIRAVVEEFNISGLSDRLINPSLTRDALLPPSPVKASDVSGPSLAHLSWDFPFLPFSSERGIQFVAQRLEPSLEIFPDRVNRGIVGDGFERDVRHPLVDEALSYITMRRRIGLDLANDLPSLARPSGLSARCNTDISLP